MAICTSFIEPLNLECIFINTLAGGVPIFFGIFLIALSLLAGKFKMNGFAFLTMLILFSILMTKYMEGIYILMLALGGIMIYYVFSRINQ